MMTQTKTKWDGKKRAATLIIDVLGAADTDENRHVTMELLALEANNRPIPYIGIIYGPTAIGKTRLIEKLSRGGALPFVDTNSKTEVTREPHVIIEVGVQEPKISINALDEDYIKQVWAEAEAVLK